MNFRRRLQNSIAAFERAATDLSELLEQLPIDDKVKHHPIGDKLKYAKQLAEILDRVENL